MNFSRLSGSQKGIVGLTAATAVIHIFLALISLSDIMFFIIFLLNGIGYLALVAALYFLPQFESQRGMVRWLLLGFTAVTFILYFVFNWPDILSPIGLVDKLIELVLMVLLFQEK